MPRKGLFKCIVIMMLVFPVLLQNIAYGEFDEHAEYGDIGYREEHLKSIAEDSVVIRIENNLYYFDNVGASFSFNTEIVPYLNGDSLSAPVESILKNFGYTTRIDGEKLFAIKDGNTISFSTDGSGFNAHMRHGYIYADVSEIALALNMKYYENGVIGIIGNNINPSEITNEIAEELSAGLSYKWDSVHLGALGYVTTLVTHPKNPELFYAVSDVGGFYKLDRENNKFVQLIASIPYQIKGAKSVRGAAIDHNDENVIYIASGRWRINNPGGIFKSVDQGKVWRKLDFPDDVNVGQGTVSSSRMSASNIYVDPINSNIVYVNTVGSGLWRSVDAGESWKKVSGIPEGWTTLDGTFVYVDGSEKINGKAKYVFAGFSGGGLAMSQDGGETFKAVQGSPLRPFDMVYSDGGYYVSGNGDPRSGEFVGFFRFKDGEWTDLTPIYNGQRYPSGHIVVDPKDKNHIILAGAPFQANVIFSSYNGGKSWETLGSFGDVSDITLDPVEENGLWLPFGAGIKFMDDYTSPSKEIRMRDYGIEMLVVQKGMSIPDPKAPLFHATFMDHGFRAVESIYERSPDTLPFMNTGCGSDFCEEDNRIVYKVGLKGQPPSTGGLIDISYDYGRTFTRLPWDIKMGNMGIVDVAVSATVSENKNPIAMVVCTGIAQNNGEGRGIYRTLDGGQNWEICKDVNVTRKNADFYQIRSIASDRVNGNVFYYMDAYEIYRTMNGGKTWEVIKTLEKSNAWCCIKTIPGIEGGIWHFDPDGQTFTSYDFGQTWKKIEGINRAGKAAGFGIGKPGTKYPAVYMGGCEDGSDVYGIYMSDDLGETWRKISTDGNQLIVGSLDINGDRKVYGRCFVSAGGSALFAGWPVEIDDQAPIITLDNNNSTEDLGPEYAVNDDTYTISGKVNEICEIRINGQDVLLDGYDRFSYNISLKDGMNKFLIEAKDEAGNFATPVELYIRKVPGFFDIGLDCGTKIVTAEKEVKISGYLVESATVYIDGNSVKTDENNRFSYTKKIDGSCKVQIYAVDNQGNTTTVKEIDVVFDKVAPSIKFDSEDTSTERFYKLISGTLDEPGEVMINGTVVKTDSENRFSHKLSVDIGSTPSRVIARDFAGNVAKPKDFYIERIDVDKSNIVATRLSDKFVYDGDISEWDLKYHCDKLISGVTDNDISFGLMYDDVYLYVGVRVEDGYINTGLTPNYANDSIEFYIDGCNEKSFAYDSNDKQICCVVDESYMAGDNYKFKLTPFGYMMEFRFKLSDYGVKPAPGTVIGFELTCNDNDKLTEAGGRDGVFGFNANSDSWKNTEDFSNCTFVE